MPANEPPVNLAGIATHCLRRGIRSPSRKFRVTPTRIDAPAGALPSAPKMKQRTRVHFHSGQRNRRGSLSAQRQELAPGQSAFVTARFQDDVLLLTGDTFSFAANFRQLTPRPVG